jgi:hypothetical protein
VRCHAGPYAVDMNAYAMDLCILIPLALH